MGGGGYLDENEKLMDRTELNYRINSIQNHILYLEKEIVRLSDLIQDYKDATTGLVDYMKLKKLNEINNKSDDCTYDYFMKQAR